MRPSTSARPPRAPVAAPTVAGPRWGSRTARPIHGWGRGPAHRPPPRSPPSTTRLGFSRLHRLGHATADVAADVGDHPAAARVPVAGQLDHPLHRQIRSVAGLEQRQDVAGGGEGLQAAAVAAAADRAGFVQRDVPDLARRAAGAAVDLTVDHQAGADAAGHLDVRQVLHPPPAAPDQLAEGAEVGVVVHVHGHAEALRELLAAGWCRPSPAGSRSSPGSRTPRRSGPGRRGPTPMIFVRPDPDARDQASDQVLPPGRSPRPQEASTSSGSDSSASTWWARLPDRDPQVGVAEVDADDDARRHR